MPELRQYRLKRRFGFLGLGALTVPECVGSVLEALFELGQAIVEGRGHAAVVHEVAELEVEPVGAGNSVVSL